MCAAFIGASIPRLAVGSEGKCLLVHVTAHILLSHISCSTCFQTQNTKRELQTRR